MKNRTHYKNKYRIPSARKKGYDYGADGIYFVTICTFDKEYFFGEVENDEMQFSEIGAYAKHCWLKIPDHFPYIVIDEFIVMPNHIHGIIVINKSGLFDDWKDIDERSVETQDLASLQEKYYSLESNWSPNKFGPQTKNLGSIIRGFKIGVTKYANENKILFEWQSRFYDRIIHDEKSLHVVRRYIYANPYNWSKDELNIPAKGS